MPPWRSYHAEEDGDASVLEGTTKPDPDINGLLGNNPYSSYMALCQMAIRFEFRFPWGFNDLLGFNLNRGDRDKLCIIYWMDL